MDSIGQDLINLLLYLLPGFLSAWVYYGLTSFKLPSQFERVVQALIFTLLIQPLAYMSEVIALFIGKYASLGVWSKNSELTASVISAIVLGVAFAYFTNNDKFHRLMRFFKITRETSYPSEWFGAFNKNITYVVLHLNDGNRIYGWPTEWPSQAGCGHFLLEDSSWLDDDNNEIPMSNVKNILIPAGNVTLVEFMELQNVKKSA